MEGNIPIVRDEATVDRILRAYCHLFPEITPELNSYWNFARTPRHGLLPFLTSNFLEAHYGQYLSLHRHIEGMRQDLSLQERAAELMDASRRAGVGLSIGLSPWTDDALLDTWDASKREAVIVLETVSKRLFGAVNLCGELLTSGIGTTEAEEMGKPIIDDELWTLIEPLLPPAKPRREKNPGRLPVSNRAALTGILFVLKTGLRWRDLPAEMGCGSGVTCWRRLRDWQAA
ncbi:Putative transposase of IS4/5 family, partial [Burkholderia sp. NFACC33-1]